MMAIQDSMSCFAIHITIMCVLYSFDHNILSLNYSMLYSSVSKLREEENGNTF